MSTPIDLQARADSIASALDEIIKLNDGFGEQLAGIYPEDSGIRPAFDDARAALIRVKSVVQSRFDRLAAEAADLEARDQN